MDYRQVDLAQCVGETYIAAFCTGFLINTRTGKFVAIKENEEKSFPVPAEGDVLTELQKYTQAFVPQQDRAQLLNNLQALLREGAAYSGRDAWIYRHENGTDKHWVGVRLLMLQCPAKEDAMALIMFKTVDNYRAQELRHQEQTEQTLAETKTENREKTEFIVRLSRDMHTPLNAVIGLARVALAHPNNTEKMLQSMERIKANAEYLEKYLSDVLDVSILETGMRVVQQKEFSVYTLLQSVNALLEQQLGERRVEFRLRKADTVRETYVGDEEHLRSLLVHILAIAAHNTPDGAAVRLSIAETDCTQGTAQLTFTVCATDETVGEIWRKVLESSDAVDGSNAQIDKALPVAQQMARVLSGKLSAQAQQGKGSSLTLQLPLRCPAPKQDGNVHCLAHRRVLVAEDNEMNAEVACSMLALYEIETETVANGKQAVESFLASPAGYYAAILMDIRMPVMDGFTAAQIVRETHHADAKTIPIIAVTADTAQTSAKTLQQAGIQACLAKPLQVEQLFSELCKAINKESKA